jgi:hypothetical protein
MSIAWRYNSRAMAQVVNSSLAPVISVFSPRPVHVSFVVDKLALEKFFLPILRVFPVIVFLTMLLIVIHLSTTDSV